ncbi:MAG: hypothetical protein IT539_17250 [Bradyrhizobiaceae bacterium]|nr:hypothetical protein [Bradyrhizobiaceae bacterium]
MARERVDWIAEGEKYAFVGLDVKVENNLPNGLIAPSLWVVSEPHFQVPSHWREWLGTIRTEEVEAANLFLLSKIKSERPDVLDSENQLLQRLVSLFYAGLLLASTFAPAHRPVVLTGSRHKGEIDFRQQGDFEIPVPCAFRPYPALTAKDLATGARIAGKIKMFGDAPIPNGTWRFFRVLHLYQETRTTPDILERLHQYSRCIDGLILPSRGETKRHFKSRSEVFIGPRHHDLMAEIYDVRSAVEHLHENRYLENFDREVRLDLLKKEAIVEHIARTSLSRIIENPELWRHFANTTSLGAFWSLPEVERRRLWGDPIDPMTAIDEFDPKYIHDGLLGARNV